jgi:hypothetical protein
MIALRDYPKCTVVYGCLHVSEQTEMKDFAKSPRKGVFISLPTLTYITGFVPFKQGSVSLVCSKRLNSHGQIRAMLFSIQR